MSEPRRRSGGRQRAKPAAPRPLWRRGTFWFVVILVEIVFAGAESAVFDHSVKEISTEGADIGNLCVEVTKLDPLGLASAPMLPGDGAPAAKEAAAYRRLVPYAP